MKKRRLLIAGIIAISVCSIIISFFVYKNYQRQKREQQERMEAIHRFELECVVYVTSGKCFLRDEDEIIPEFDTGYVIIKVALYNECIDRGVQKGEKISGYMEVQEEFDDFISGKRTLEECRAINALSDFNKAECYSDYENVEQGITYSYNRYTTMVGEELGIYIGEKTSDYTVHTNSEVEAASEIAAKNGVIIWKGNKIEKE